MGGGTVRSPTDLKEALARREKSSKCHCHHGLEQSVDRMRQQQPTGGILPSAVAAQGPGGAAPQRPRRYPEQRKGPRSSHTSLSNTQCSKQGTSCVTRSRAEEGFWGQTLGPRWPTMNTPERPRGAVMKDGLGTGTPARLTASSGMGELQNLKFPASSRASGPHRDGANREGLGVGVPPRRAPGSPTNTEAAA